MDSPDSWQRLVPRWAVRVGVSGWLFIGAAAGAAAIIAVAVLAKDVTVPVLIACFLAAVLIPAVDRLEARGVNRSIGAVAVLLAIAVVISVGATLVVGAVTSQSDQISARLDDSVEQIDEWISTIDAETLERVRSTVEAFGRDGGTGGVIAGAAGFASSTVALLAGMVLGAMVLYYLLKDGHSLRASLTGERLGVKPGTGGRLLAECARDVQRYAYGKTVLALLQGVAIGAAAAVLGVPMALAIGVVNFIGAYVPYLGAFVGGSLAVLLGIAAGGLPLGLAMLAVALIANLVLENALEPRLLGSVLHLHPLVVLIVTVAGGLFAGLVGLILAAPCAAIVRRIHRELVESGFYDRPEAVHHKEPS